MTPPNVLVVVMDDLAYGDLACHGNPYVRTPRLDALHGESTRLTRYSSGPMCTPARASLLTGRYHQRTRAYDTFCGRSMLDPTERTLAQVLRDAGYRTGCFGKWHLGDAYPMRAMDLGFDETLVHGAGGIGQAGDHRENHWREGESYFGPVLSRNGEAVRTEGYCTDEFVDASVKFVTEADRPWFCYLATNAPHTPLEVPERWVEPYRSMDGLGEVHARLYGMVENIDWNVGRLLDAVDPATTLVLYTSDHGPCPSARDFTLPPDGQVRWNAGLRGEKGSLYDGAVKVPSFWRLPGTIPAGVDLDVIASPIDVLPTVAAACGIDPPDGVDGIDLLPTLTTGAPVERTLFLQWHRGNTQERYRNYAVVRGPHKLHRPVPEAADELYDLTADPGEATDLAAAHPDVVAELRAAYDAWFDDVSTTRPDNWAPPRIVLGVVPVTLSRQDWRIEDGLADMGELAGWMATTKGWWEVAVPAPATAAVEVRLDPFSWSHPSFFATVHLRVGDRTYEQPWVLQVTKFDFTVELPAGDTTVEAWAEGASGRQSALYVDVSATT